LRIIDSQGLHAEVGKLKVEVEEGKEVVKRERGELMCVAVCCDVSQRVAACCSVLRCWRGVPVRRRTWCSARGVRCSVLQRVAACCSVLQRVAVLQRGADKELRVEVGTFKTKLGGGKDMVRGFSCSVVQCIAGCCSLLQCVTMCCSVLYCVDRA